MLIVEDEQDIAGLIKHTLSEAAKSRREWSSSGDTALKSAIEEPPDLIILDLNLPVAERARCLPRLRSRPATSRIPIIMLTARTSESDRVSGLGHRRRRLVTKPFSLRELAARVRAVLRRGKADGSPQPVRCIAASTSSPTSTPWP